MDAAANRNQAEWTVAANLLASIGNMAVRLFGQDNVDRTLGSNAFKPGTQWSPDVGWEKT